MGDKVRSRSRSRSKSKSRSNGRDGSEKKQRSCSRDKVQENEGNNLYLSNLSYRLQDSDLKDSFSEYGPLSYYKVIRDKSTDKSRGFGFVTYERVEDATEALKEMQNKEIMGRKITIQVASRARPHDPTPGKYLGKETRGYYEQRYEARTKKRSHSRERDRYSRYSPKKRWSPDRRRRQSPRREEIRRHSPKRSHSSQYRSKYY